MLEEKIKAAAAVCVRAFHGGKSFLKVRAQYRLLTSLLDPLLRMMTGDDPRMEPMLFESMLRNVLEAGMLYVITPTESHEILAVALWFGPGKKLNGT